MTLISVHINVYWYISVARTRLTLFTASSMRTTVEVCVCVCVCVRARVFVRDCVYIGLDFAEFHRGMKDMCAHIHLTRDDFDIITENGKARFL